MTTPGEPREDQPRSGGQEPTPFDQQETQFAQIPPPDFPAYTPPPTPPAGSTPPPNYPPPPSYTPPPQAYPPPPSYQQQQPYQSGYPSAPYAGGYGPPKSRTNGMAIGSMVTSIAGLVFGIPLMFLCFVGFIPPIVGIVLGIIALNQIKQSGEEGRGFALAGIIVGAVSFIPLIIVFAIYAASIMSS